MPRPTELETSELERCPGSYGLFATDVSSKVISNLVYAAPEHPNTRPKIKIADSELPLVRSPKILGVCLDTFFSFNKWPTGSEKETMP